MKNIKLLFALIVTSLFIACTNFVEPESIRSGHDISFTLSKDVASEITRTLQKNNNVDNNSQIKIECQLVGISAQEMSKNILLKDIGGTRFSFSNVPANIEFRAKISVLYNNFIIYEGFSEPNKITPETRDIYIKLIVEKKPSVIKYELNNNGVNSSSNPSEYYIDSQVTLSDPATSDSNLIFSGWYATPDFSGEKVTKLGSDNFIGNLTLYAKWTYSMSITGLNAERGNGKVNLSWNPVDDLNCSKIIISCPELKNNVELDARSISNKEISLPNGKKYNFAVKAVHKKGFESEAVRVKGETWYTLTDEIEELPAGTEGSYGQNGKYVLFGDFPQTKASISTNNIVLETDNINGTDYAMGDDGYYYEYVLSSEKQGVYYKVEPIKWRVLTDKYVDGSGTSKGRLLMAENALTAIDFYKGAGDTASRPENIYGNNYKYSNIRAYLNSLDGSSYDAYDYSPVSGFKGFIDSAFNKKAQSKLVEVEVDNSVGSTGQTENKYVCENTKDKVFLMSYKELTTSEFGFNTNGNSADSKRNRKVTDYSKDKAATGGVVSAEGVCDYWLRSPSNSMEEVRVFIDYNNDGTLKQYLHSNEYGRVVPAVVVQ